MTSGNNPYAAPRSDRREPGAEAVSAAGIFDRDKYLLKQKLIAISEKYFVYGEQDEVLLHVKRPARVLAHLLNLFVIVLGVLVAMGAAAGLIIAEQPVLGVIVGGVLLVAAIALGVRLSPLRHLEFRAGGPEGRILLSISQDNRWTIPHFWFTLRDGDGAVLARFQKNIFWNLFRRRWYVHAPDGSLAFLVKEDSVLKSILRRMAPDIIAAFMRTNFVFLEADGQQRLGAFNRKLSFRDNYVIDLGADTERSLDRRIAVAAAVLLDTGERR